MYKIPTISGKQFDLCTPDASMVDIVDIAHSLAQQPRFTGHLQRIGDRVYTLAQHCVHVSEQSPEPYWLAGLLHDAPEAYTGDLSRKLKLMLGRTYAAQEARIEQAVAERFGLSWPMTEFISEIDDRMAVTEHRDLGHGELQWDDPTQIGRAHV